MRNRRNSLLRLTVALIAFVVMLASPLRTQVTPAKSAPAKSVQFSTAKDTGSLPLARVRSSAQGAVPLIFMPPIFSSSDGLAGGLAVADLNHDGLPDVVAANYQDSVSILLGNGDGTFREPVTYPSGGYSARSVAIADFNGDGNPDLVVANKYGYSSSPLTILLGNGDGTFQPAVTIPIGSGSGVSVATYDLNGDGKPDLVAGFDQIPAVVAVLGNGDGSFGDAWGSGIRGAFGFGSLAVADVNLDGKLDMVATIPCSGTYYCESNGTVNIFLANGDGTFQPAIVYDSGSESTVSGSVADLNRDGFPDLLLQVSYDTLGIMPGNGDGTFGQLVTFKPGLSLGGPVIADVNCDGKRDVIALGGWGITLLAGNGDGTFQSPITFDAGNGSAVIADVNGDKLPDIVMAGSYNVSVLLNNSSAPSTNTALSSSVNPADVQQTVSYTATVASQSGEELNGTVTFKDGDRGIATVALQNNQAVYSTSYTKHQLGMHPITASYSGQLHVALGSRSATLAQYVRNTVSKTVVATSGSPSFVGQPVTFTATVTSKRGQIPDGDLVTFYDGTTIMSSVALTGGTAMYTTSSLSVKNHMIKCVYAGDNYFEPSTGSVRQLMLKNPTATTLSSYPNPSSYGQTVSFTATVAPTGPYPITGKVRFFDGTKIIGAAALKSGIATLNKSTLAVGAHPITAQYLGDANNDKSTSPVLEQVVQ